MLTTTHLYDRPATIEEIKSASFWYEPSYTEVYRYAPQSLSWYYVEHYPLTKFGSAEEWKAFFEQAQRERADECDPGQGYYDDLLDEIIEPVVIVDDGNQIDLWDGNHRIGGSFVAGRLTIKALIGIKK